MVQMADVIIWSSWVSKATKTRLWKPITNGVVKSLGLKATILRNRTVCTEPICTKSSVARNILI